MCKPGHVYTVARNTSDKIGVYNLRYRFLRVGKIRAVWFWFKTQRQKESSNVAYNYLKANTGSISGTIKLRDTDFHLHAHDLMGAGLADDIGLAAFITLCSGAMGRPVQDQMVVLGSMSIGGTIVKVEDLATPFRCVSMLGANESFCRMSSAADIPSVPPELFTKFQTSFYQIR